MEAARPALSPLKHTNGKNCEAIRQHIPFTLTGICWPWAPRWLLAGSSSPQHSLLTPGPPALSTLAQDLLYIWKMVKLSVTLISVPAFQRYCEVWCLCARTLHVAAVVPVCSAVFHLFVPSIKHSKKWDQPKVLEERHWWCNLVAWSFGSP